MPKPSIIKPSKSLDLPNGYQRFDWYSEGQNENGIVLNNPEGMFRHLKISVNRTLYCYTQHEIFFENDVLKQTRSSPNYEGGLVTYATCKHLVRTYDRTSSMGWKTTLIVGLCPSSLDNCVLFCGVIWKEFPSNYDLSRFVKDKYPSAFAVKQADCNPRGDLYTPKTELIKLSQKYDHTNFQEPPNHTRSVEFYKKSPGSKSERKDGKIPKWWRDMEYISNSGNRPVSFILNPCFIFSKPMVWTEFRPGRATLNLHPPDFADSLSY